METKSITQGYIFVVTANDGKSTNDYYYYPAFNMGGAAYMYLKSCKDINRIDKFNSCEEAIEWWNNHKTDYDILFFRFTIIKIVLIEVKTTTVETELPQFSKHLSVFT